MPTTAEPSAQFTLFGEPSRTGAVARAVERLKSAPSEARGAIHTRPTVARFILDLAGYVRARPLHAVRLLEPSFGDGVFLDEAVTRLLDAWEAHGHPGGAEALSDAIRAVEVHAPTFQATRERLHRLLTSRGIGNPHAASVLDAWLVCDDFLLTPLVGAFDMVVGNPPYVRQESIAPALVTRYREE